MSECPHKYHARTGETNTRCNKESYMEDCPGEDCCVSYQRARAEAAEAEVKRLRATAEETLRRANKIILGLKELILMMQALREAGAGGGG